MVATSLCLLGLCLFSAPYTHANHEDWCEHCQKGRGRPSPHLTGREDGREAAEEEVNLVATDYTFLGTQDLENNAHEFPVLVVADTRSRGMSATAVEAKGPAEWIARLGPGKDGRIWNVEGGCSNEGR